MEGDAGRAGSFFGRGDVVEALRRRFGELRAGASAVTLLVGETGVGKSTLLSEFVPEMRTKGVRVLVGRAPPVDDPPPFSLLQSALGSARDDPLLRSDEDPTMGSASMMIGFVPGVGEDQFSKPVGLEARLLDALAGTDAPRTATQEQVLAGITERFVEFTRHGPTVLVLEDLHRADKSSLAAVEFFASELEDRPLWFLATTRPAPSLSSLGRERLERFERATRAERVVLRPMTSDEATEFLRITHPSRVLSPEEVARRFSESGGNPYLLQQLDHRKPSEDETTEAPPRGRSSLEDEEQQVLDLAAVLGPEFSFSLLLKASEEDEERLAEEVDRLVGRGLLFERPGELLEFPQDRLREEVYNYLSERRRRVLHRRAGTALETLGRTDSARVYALARHYYLGREAQKSVQYNRIAAEIAERSLAPEAAWEYFVHALESHRQISPEDADGEAELVLGLARITEELGVLKESEEILRDFLERAEREGRLSAGRRATLEVFLCRVLAAEGNLPATKELARKILETPGLEQQLLVQVGAHHHLGMVLYYEGRYAEALGHHTEEIELARRVGNPLVLARAQIWRIANLQMLGETVQAIAEAREVTAARDRLGSVRESAMAHLVLGDILADARSPPADRKDAIGEYASAIRFAEAAKDPRRVGWALYKTADLLREEGRFEEALESISRACHILGEVGDRVGLGVSVKTRGRIAMDQGDLERAETDLLEALRLLRGTENALEEIDLILRLAQFYSVRGDREAARQFAGDLTKLDLPRHRPDLADEFDRLRRSLDADGASPQGPRA